MDDISALETVLENEDVLYDIFNRLPAKHFASAACVSKCWNKVGNQILSRPKLATALALNPSLHVAVQEVVDKVLSKPIRPHFAIAYVSRCYNLAAAHALITGKLGSQIPVITNAADGMIGKDVHTDGVKEVRWALLEHVHDVPNNIANVSSLVSLINYGGIVLVVGCMPGLKVEAIPFLRSRKDARFPWPPKVEMIDKFLTDIKEYTSTVSDCSSPDAIIMFGDQRVDLKPVLVKMDNNLPSETVIVGDASASFMYRSGTNYRNYPSDHSYFIDAISLVFAKEKSSNVAGNIQFSLTLSNGLIPFGPQLEVAAIIIAENNTTWFIARMIGHTEYINARKLFREVYETTEDRKVSFYIRVIHKAENSIQSQRSYVAYHKVLREAGDVSIIVDGVGIKPGDSFMFCHTDSAIAFVSMFDSINELEKLKAAAASTSQSSTITRVGQSKEIFGGLIFSCFTRGEPYVGNQILESLPFHVNYPTSGLAGLFSKGEIARVSTNLFPVEENDENGDGEDVEISNFGWCYLHYFSTISLLMAYSPQP